MKESVHIWEEKKLTELKKNYGCETMKNVCDITIKTKSGSNRKHLKDTTKISGIYKILNKINGKYYIGSSKNINVGYSGRFNRHKRELKYNKHINSHLQNAWNKYGEQNFNFLIIEQCDCNVSKKDLLLLEQKYLNIAKTEKDMVYNIKFHAICPIINSYSDEEKKKRGKLGKLNPSFDLTIYKFKNKHTNENFQGYRSGLIETFKCKSFAESGISSLISGRRKSYKGWTLVK
jgi:group I intron endonuclease